MSYTSVVVTICDGCGREVTTRRSTEDDIRNPNREFEDATKHWFTFYEHDISGKIFCCWDCVRAFAEYQISIGKNRLEDDLAQ